MADQAPHRPVWGPIDSGPTVTTGGPSITLMGRWRLAYVTVFLVGCAGTTMGDLGPLGWQIPAAHDRAGEVVLAASGDTDDLRDALLESGSDERSARLWNAELDFLEGQFTRSFERFADVLIEDPTDLMGALAAVRLTLLVNWIANDEGMGAVIDALADVELPPLTATHLNALAIDLAHERHQRLGYTEAAPFSAAEYGMPDAWRSVGPFSRLSRLHLDRTEPIDDDVVMAPSYTSEGREISAREHLGNRLSLSLPADDSGTYVLETWAYTEQPTSRLLVLETKAGAVVTLNGMTVVGRTETGDYDPTLLPRPVHLEAGWHRLRVRVAAGARGGDLRIRLVASNLRRSPMQFEPLPPPNTEWADAQLAPVATDPAGGPSVGWLFSPEVLEPIGASEAYALLVLARSLGSDPLAWRGLDWLLSQPSSSALVTHLAARVVGSERALPPNQQENQQLQWLRQTLEIAPSAGAAALDVSAMLGARGMEDEALELMLALEGRLPNEPVVQMGLYHLYRARGLDELAERALDAVLALAPEGCRAVEELIDLYRFRDHYPPVSTLPSGFRVCEVGLRYHLDNVLLPEGRIDEATELLRLLSARHPDRHSYHRRLFDLFMLEGRYDDAADQLERASRFAMDTTERQTLETDLLLTRGQAEEALGLVSEALAEEPGDYDLRRRSALLSRRRVLDDLRVDTADAIAAYRALGFQSEAPMVYALDYGGYRYFEDGSAVLVTHQILHLQSREALGEYGEVSTPRGSYLLRARTVKADGTVLEPDAIAGTGTVSLPNLELGDFVEYEYLEVLPANGARAATVVGPRFYFQVLESPLARSIMVIEVPNAWPELVVDGRGGAPPAEIEAGDDFRRYRFVVTDSLPTPNEPAMPSLDELLPSVRIAHDHTWEDVRDAYLDRSLAVVRVTPALDDAVDLLVGNAPTPRERARRLFRFAVDEVDETGGFFDVDAIWTLRQREGERLPLLLAMLRAAGLEADPVFLRSWGDDQTDSPIPDPDAYPRTAIRVRADDDTIWLNPEQENAPFDYLGPDIQGCDGFVITGQRAVEWVTTPVWSGAGEQGEIHLTLQIDEDGNLTGAAEERVAAGKAPAVRRFLETLQDERSIYQALESALADSFPGVVLEGFETTHADSPDETLLLSYAFSAPAFATIGPAIGHGAVGRGAVGDGDASRLVIAGRVFDRQLRYILGSEPTRSYPLSVDYPLSETLHTRVELPAGYRFEQVPEEVLVETPWLTYQTEVRIAPAGDWVEITRVTELPVTRVSPEDYPVLLSALAEIDDAEELLLVARR